LLKQFNERMNTSKSFIHRISREKNPDTPLTDRKGKGLRETIAGGGNGGKLIPYGRATTTIIGRIRIHENPPIPSMRTTPIPMNELIRKIAGNQKGVTSIFTVPEK
jgi:hypothetical protein